MSVIDRLSTAYRKLTRSKKDIPFDNTGSSNSPVIIYPNMNSWQDWILRAISPNSQPSDDPHLSALVAAGITWLALTLPEPDLQVKKGFRRKREGKKRDDEVIENHSFYKLMDEPNPEDTGSDLWKGFAYSWIIKGNVFFIKFRNVFGQVVRIYYEPHHKIRARWINDRQGEYIPAERSLSVPVVERSDSPALKINYYEVDRNGKKCRIEPADVIHFKDGIDPFNERYGISRIQTILREIFQDSAVASYAADLLGGGGTIPYVIGIEDKEGVFKLEDLEVIKARLIAQTTGENAGKPLVLNSRHTFTRTALTPEEMDLRSTRSMAQDIFSMVTGIPQIVLNMSSGLERSIYNNMSEADRRAVQSYLMPIWWHRDQVLTRRLLRDIDPDESHFIESDLSEVGALQEDEALRWKRLGQAYQDGWLKRSEVRAEAQYESDPDGKDDVYYVKPGSAVITVEEEEEARQEPDPAESDPMEQGLLSEGQTPKLLPAPKTGKPKLISERTQ